MYKRHRDKQDKQAWRDAQTDRPYVPPVVAPGSNAPLFTGIRVVEFSTHLAGPTVGRCMS
ncbi:hypothetical protein SARC_11814, partial [Sphaeroforma arctica JP610]